MVNQKYNLNEGSSFLFLAKYFIKYIHEKVWVKLEHLLKCGNKTKMHMTIDKSYKRCNDIARVSNRYFQIFVIYLE